METIVLTPKEKNLLAKCNRLLVTELGKPKLDVEGRYEWKYSDDLVRYVYTGHIFVASGYGKLVTPNPVYETKPLLPDKPQYKGIWVMVHTRARPSKTYWVMKFSHMLRYPDGEEYWMPVQDAYGEYITLPRGHFPSTHATWEFIRSIREARDTGDKFNEGIEKIQKERAQNLREYIGDKITPAFAGTGDYSLRKNGSWGQLAVDPRPLFNPATYTAPSNYTPPPGVTIEQARQPLVQKSTTIAEK